MRTYLLVPRYRGTQLSLQRGFLLQLKLPSSRSYHNLLIRIAFNGVRPIENLICGRC